MECPVLYDLVMTELESRNRGWVRDHNVPAVDRRISEKVKSECDDFMRFVEGTDTRLSFTFDETNAEHYADVLADEIFSNGITEEKIYGFFTTVRVWVTETVAVQDDEAAYKLLEASCDYYRRNIEKWVVDRGDWKGILKINEEPEKISDKIVTAVKIITTYILSIVLSGSVGSI